MGRCPQVVYDGLRNLSCEMGGRVEQRENPSGAAVSVYPLHSGRSPVGLWRSFLSRIGAGGTGAVYMVLVGCSREDRDLPDVLMELAIPPDPPQNGPTRVTVMLADAGGLPITSARVELEANMSHAGMVPVPAQAAKVAPGRYEKSLEFTRGGAWFILVHADLPDGRALERKVDVPGVDLVCGETPAP